MNIGLYEEIKATKCENYIDKDKSLRRKYPVEEMISLEKSRDLYNEDGKFLSHTHKVVFRCLLCQAYRSFLHFQMFITKNEVFKIYLQFLQIDRA